MCFTGTEVEERGDIVLQGKKGRLHGLVTPDDVIVEMLPVNEQICFTFQNSSKI